MNQKEPLYLKIYHHFRDQILSGELKEGDPLPTEAELMAQFEVSRTTVKGALNALKSDGYLLRRQGSGSFVAPHPGQIGDIAKKVAFLCPANAGEHFLQMVEGINRVLSREGYQLAFYFLNQKPLLLTVREVILQAKADGCEGILYYPLTSQDSADIFCHLVSEEYPVVLLDKKIGNLPIPCVVSDNASGMERLTHRMIEKGYRRFAFLSIDPTIESSLTERYYGCCRAIHAAGLPGDCIDLHTPFLGQSHEAMGADRDQIIQSTLMELLGQLHEQGVDMIFAVNDYVALRVCRALNQLRVKIPDQMAVSGFDNLSFTEFSTPPITTVEQNFFELGRVGAETLLDQIRCPGQKTEARMVPTRIIERETT